MHLEPLFTLRVAVLSPVEVGEGPFGKRIVARAGEGTFEGARLRGKILPGGGDWILADKEGGMHLDVRVLLKTDDGAHVYVHYAGVLVMTDRVSNALSTGGATAYGDTYFMIQPRFETGDPRYQWLNHILAAGEGRLSSGMIEYQIYALANAPTKPV